MDGMAGPAAAATGQRDAAVMMLVGSAHFASHFLQLALAPLFPILNIEFGVSFTELGFVVTLFYIASGLGQATAGVLVDRYGAHRLLVCGLALMSTSVALAGLTQHYWMLLPLAAVAGLGNAVFHPADLSILSHRVSALRLGRGYAVHGIMGSLGFVTAPALIGAVAAGANWRVALVVAGALGLAIAGVLHVSRALLIYERRAGTSQVAGAAPRLTGYLGLIGSPVVLLGFAYFALTAVAGTGVQTFAISALAEGYGLALRVATLGLTAYLIGSSCGMVLGGFLADKTDQHHRVAMIGIAVVASLMLLIAAAPGIGAVAVPVLFAAGVAGGITSPSRDVLIRRAAAGAGAGTGSIFGFVYSGLDLGSALAPPIFGALIDYHAAQVAFLAIAAAYALAAPTVMQVQSRAAAGRHVPAIAG